MNKICFIDDCSQYQQENTSFHRFPTDPDLCRSWCQSINTFNNQENAFGFHRNSYVCGHHFPKTDKFISGKKTMLYKNVIPTIYPRNCEIEHNHNEPIEIGNEPFDTTKDPLVERNNWNEQITCVESVSDCEDFLGFDTDDLMNYMGNASTGEVYIITEVEDGVNRDQTNSENKVEPANDVHHTSTSDSKEIDDEIIFVENDVEVIEIDDDDDNEIHQTIQMKKDKKLSRYEIQQMLITNNPQIVLRKPKLDWKSDQFRLVYINDESQNLCTCTKCWELFEEINIDNVVRHARCNPTPSISPSTKKRKVIDQQENKAVQRSEDISVTSVQNLTTVKIQTVAACMDVQTSTFYQSKSFLRFAQFLIDAGASVASMNKNRLTFEPKYEALCSFRDQLKHSQLSKISSILNDLTIDFSLSCEIWEDSFRGKTIVLLELHYLNDKFLRHRIVIGAKVINDIGIEDSIICDKVLESLKIYSDKSNGAEFLQRAVAFVTSRKLDTQSLETISFPSACSIVNEIADEIINDDRFKIAEKCLHVIGWLNVVSTEKITEFDARKWENIFNLFKRYNQKKKYFIQQSKETTFPKDYSILQLLEPFHNAVVELSESKNNITKVFGIFKSLEISLMPLTCDKEMIKYVKRKALVNLRTAFADSDAYQICMFLDPSNRDQYNSLESDKMDSLQSKIDLMINPYISSTKENGCVDNDLIHYMDDNVTSQQNQIDLFLQRLIPSNGNPYEFWRETQNMSGLKTLARKYFTISTYVSLSECKFSKDAVDSLVKRNTLEIKDIEMMLMMNSS